MAILECDPPVFGLVLLLDWVRPLGLSTNIYTEIYFRHGSPTVVLVVAGMS